jgi:hypothetical protein
LGRGNNRRNAKRNLGYGSVHEKAEESKRRYLVIAFILCPLVILVFLLFVACHYSCPSNADGKVEPDGEEEDDEDTIDFHDTILGIFYSPDEYSEASSDTETVDSLAIDDGEAL